MKDEIIQLTEDVGLCEPDGDGDCLLEIWDGGHHLDWYIPFERLRDAVFRFEGLTQKDIDKLYKRQAD